MTSTTVESENGTDALREQLTAQLELALKEKWGFDSFRPQQLDALLPVMEDRDTLVIFPTGGGKSICFQVPAVCREGVAVVISPLISLMKDQVDGLKANGVKAAFLNSTLSMSEERDVWSAVENGQLDLLYMAPERILSTGVLQRLSKGKVAFFAIDEAHCVSQWGHDFRPEYRKLAVLKQKFPSVGVHAYTATATEKVRDDIAQQLGLVDPIRVIGSMDRPNLNYQVTRRHGGIDQIVQVLKRHSNQSGIVYCISRKNVEATSAALNALGFRTLPYHAGLSSQERQQNQDAFLQESADVIVATVAFGMGIDKSNVRFVVHAEMPKSLEAYQQESGRAGRDGLPAECWLLYSSGDFVTWGRIIESSESREEQSAASNALRAISDFCSGVSCRHVALSAHFGETLESQSCGACDVCLGELEMVDDPLVLGQKIVSCVYRVDQNFGADYVAQVLVGSRDQRILKNQHDQLSTYGLLEQSTRREVRDWIEQLVGQKFLMRSGDYNVIKITEQGTSLLKGQTAPKLLNPNNGAMPEQALPDDVDHSLFDSLDTLRGQFAQQRNVAAHLIFSDASLRDMARRRPSNADGFRMLLGVSQQKQDDFGEAFLKTIVDHCAQNQISSDVRPDASKPAKTKNLTANAIASFKMFDDGLDLAAIAEKMGRAVSTVNGYLAQYIDHHQIADATRWIESETASRVTKAIEKVGIGPLKPVFVELNEEVDYAQIRIVMACAKHAK